MEYRDLRCGTLEKIKKYIQDNQLIYKSDLTKKFGIDFASLKSALEILKNNDEIEEIHRGNHTKIKSSENTKISVPKGCGKNMGDCYCGQSDEEWDYRHGVLVKQIFYCKECTEKIDKEKQKSEENEDEE